MKVHRMAAQFRTRTSSWKMKHFVTVFMVCFVWYTIISKRKFSDDKASILKIFKNFRYSNKEQYTENSIQAPSVRKFPDVERRKERKPILSPKKNENQQKNKDTQKIENAKKVADIPDTKNVDVVKSTRPPIILIWKAMEYQMRNYKEHLEYYSPEECGGCQVTTDRSFVQECAALVHFNSPDLRKALDVPDPKYRNPNQIYAFWSRETPAKTQHFRTALQDKRFDTIFNLTMNFRIDSDIIDYFGNVEYELRIFKTRNRHSAAINRIYQGKTGLAIWIVSNCDSTYGAAERMKYAKSLMEAGLNLTTYGSCFGKRFDGPDMNNEIMRHKFYMSLENSVHCPDYISEKFWRNGLRAGAVPIVWGPTRDDLVKIAPKHSYIHSDDFETPRDLVKYLNYLDRNDTAYREYHAWRFEDIDETIPEEDIAPNHRSTLCRLCKKVTQKPLVHRTIPSVTKWLYETRYVDNLCFK